MRLNWTTLALQLINFAILVWLLQRFLYRPVLRMMDARRAAVEKQFGEAAQAEAMAKDQLAALDAQRGGLEAERSALLKAALAEAEKAAAARRIQAEHEAAALLEEARRTLDRERRQAFKAARAGAFNLGTGIARRLLAEVPEPLRAQAWLERIDRHLSTLSATEWAALLRDLGPDAGLRIVTAAPMPAELMDAWRLRLARSPLAAHQLTFETEPKLIAGAELHFGDTTLSFSLRSAVETLRERLQPHAHAP